MDLTQVVSHFWMVFFISGRLGLNSVWFDCNSSWLGIILFGRIQPRLFYLHVGKLRLNCRLFRKKAFECNFLRFLYLVSYCKCQKKNLLTQPFFINKHLKGKQTPK